MYELEVREGSFSIRVLTAFAATRPFGRSIKKQITTKTIIIINPLKDTVKRCTPTSSSSSQAQATHL